MNKSSLLIAKFHRLRLFCRRILNKEIVSLVSKVDRFANFKGRRQFCLTVYNINENHHISFGLVFFRLTLVWEVVYLKLSLLP